MNTTKNGLKLSIFAAVLYIGALQSPLIPIFMLGLLVLTESSDAVTKLVSQALTVLGLVWLVDGVYSLITLFVNFLNSFVGSGYLHMSYALDTFITLILDAVLLVFAVLALLGHYTDLNPVIIEKAVKTVQKSEKVPDTDKGDTKQ